MKLYRLRAVARKEALHIVRDARSLGMAIAMPVLLLLLFGYALTLDVDRVPLVVWDQSQTQASRELVSHFTGSRYFALRDVVWQYRDLERAVDSGRALVALVVPREFAAQLAAGRRTSVQLIVDASDSSTAALAIGYAEAATATYSREVEVAQMQRVRGALLRPPLDLRPRVWFNTDLQSRNFIIPGLIVVIMMIIAALLTSLTVAREWEHGTMEQLIATPVKGPELILGKLIPYFALGMFDMLLAVLMGQWLFHVPMRGSVALLFGLAGVFLAGALALGMLISIVTKSQLLASQLAMVLTFVPAFLLSGFLFSISSMPRLIQLVTYLVPARYFVMVIKGIYLKGVGLEVLGVDTVFLVAFALLALGLAHWAFRKRLS
jgi:ABC-2 type transport system permease protein